MAENKEEINVNDEENEAMQKEEEDEESVRSSVIPDEAYLLELNLVMIIASLALSDQEISEFGDMEKLNAKEQDIKTFVSKLRGRKREFDECRIPDRRATRLQPKILDSRHGRKM
ncbi:hypothetical protein RND81_03G219200 [Saponaria officinalis]|uniref:Uncharacterized protein n=1 Tax=Saponaria officinalis TaxID=3572 RepID=A0AAW1M206_SAPOF